MVPDEGIQRLRNELGWEIRPWTLGECYIARTDRAIIEGGTKEPYTGQVFQHV